MNGVRRTVFADIALMGIAFSVFLLLLSSDSDHSPNEVILAAGLTVVFGVTIAFATGFYAGDYRATSHFIRSGAIAIIICVIGSAAILLIQSSLSTAIMAAVISLPVGLAAMVMRRIASRALRRDPPTPRVLVIAPDMVLSPFGGNRLIKSDRIKQVEPIAVGVNGSLPDSARERIAEFTKLSAPRIIAVSGGVDLTNGLGRELMEAARSGCVIKPLYRLLSELSGTLPLEDTDTLASIVYAQRQRSRFKVWSERAIDLAAVAALAPIVLPVISVVAIAIRLEDAGPILFRQTRVGLNGRTFDVLKFRTMRTDAEADGQAKWAQLGDSRITRIGSFLRAHRIDEIPQLLNILKGEMSLVGPRPERPELVDLLRQQVPLYDYRHCALPGLTGWAQINYPYGASVEDAAEKTRFDLYYIQRRGPLMNIFILLQTIRVVIFAEGAR